MSTEKYPCVDNYACLAQLDEVEISLVSFKTGLAAFRLLLLNLTRTADRLMHFCIAIVSHS